MGEGMEAAVDTASKYRHQHTLPPGTIGSSPPLEGAHLLDQVYLIMLQAMDFE